MNAQSAVRQNNNSRETKDIMRKRFINHKLICISAALVLALASGCSSKDRSSPTATQTDAVTDADSQDVNSDSSDTSDNNSKKEDSNSDNSEASVSSNLDNDDNGNSAGDGNLSGNNGSGNGSASGSGNNGSGNSNTTGSGNGNGNTTGSGNDSGSSGSGNGNSGSGNTTGSGSGNGSGGSTTESPKPDNPTTEAPSPSCNHNWKKVTKTVHHDEEGHWEDVIVQDAWDEKVTDYYANVCNSCGVVMKDWSPEAIGIHVLDCNGGTGYHNQEFYHIVHHDAVTERQWVVDMPAYDEYGVFDHYECTKCGAIK